MSEITVNFGGQEIAVTLDGAVDLAGAGAIAAGIVSGSVSTILGVTLADGDLGAFTGVTIPDDVAVKPALQALETAIEGIDTTAIEPAISTILGVTLADADLGIFTGTTIPNDVTVKAALQSLETETETVAGDVSTLTATVVSLASDVNTVLGVSASSGNLGTFTGVTIADNVAIKPALQALETAIEGIDTTAIEPAISTILGVTLSDGDLGTFTGVTIPNDSTIKPALQSLETALESIDTTSIEPAVSTILGVTLADADLGSFTGTTIANDLAIKPALQALETAVETKATSSVLNTLVGVTITDGDLGTFTGSTIANDLAVKPALQALETAVELRTVATTLAATGGAALTGANDASSGAKYTTVQGFLTYLLSSVGSSIVGFIQTGTGAVARTLQAKLRDAPVNIADFSTVAQAVATGRDVVFPDGVTSFDTVTVTTAGQRFLGASDKAIIRATDATNNLFNVRATGVEFHGLRFEGASTSAVNGTFAILTDIAYPAPRLKVIGCTFSGDGSTKGFNNAIKLDTGADYVTIQGNYIERLWGTASGYGYGILAGEVFGAVITENTGIGAANRGRHFVYLSGGASGCKVASNYISAFNKDGITIYSTDGQNACIGNIISGNTIVSCSDAVTNGSISLSQNVQDNIISNNIIRSSGGNGIMADGTGSTLLKNNKFIGNLIINSAYIGLELKAVTGGLVANNTIRESSTASAGTYANIRVISDNTTKTSDVYFTGNISSGATNSRSAFQINASTPLPTGIVLKGNFFETCNVAQYELSSVEIQIDGWIWKSVTWDIASTADNAIATVDAIAMPGALQGEVVLLDHTSLTAAGWFLQGAVYSNGFIRATALNKTGGTVDPASGTLTIRVKKEVY